LAQPVSCENSEEVMHRSRVKAFCAIAWLGAAAVALAGCSGDDSSAAPSNAAGGAGGAGGGGGSAGVGGSGGSGGSDAGGGLKAFTPPPSDPGSGAILFSASGEVLALGGYAFPPATPDDVAFVDGWEVKFSRLLVTVDKIELSNNPDKVPTDQSQTDGVVAEVDGPWAIDLHKGGPLVGKGGTDEQAVPIAAVTNQNQNGGAPFDPTVRYAFGFDIVPATHDAENVNLDADGLTDYEDMVANGYTVLYVGTATFKGTGCTSTDPSYDFTKLPPTVDFRLGFKSPTSYLNCQNPDNDPATPFANEEHERGVQVRSNTFVVAQVTIHTDHPFWESVVHDSPAHFDSIAAHYVGSDGGTPTARLEDFVGVDFTAFEDGAGHALPWRACLSTYTPPGTGQMSFDPQGVPVNPSASPDQALRDFADYLTYNQSTQGHLNSDGLCYVKRNYPSPQ
jgi:hypothetical protein